MIRQLLSRESFKILLRFSSRDSSECILDGESFDDKSRTLLTMMNNRRLGEIFIKTLHDAMDDV